MALGTKILRNATFLTVGDKVSNLLLFLFFLYFARKFGIVPTGEYSFAFSFTYTFVVFADLGISTYLVREVARRNSSDRQLFLDCLILKAISVFIITCVAIGIIVFFLGDFSRQKTIVIACWGIYWFFFSLADVFIAELNGHEKMGRVALLGIWHKLICLISGSILIYAGYSYTLVLVVFPIGSFIYFITCLFVSTFTLGWSKVTVKGYKEYKSLFKKLIPFYSAFILLEVLWNQDILILGFMRGDQSVGIYSSALKIVSFILGVSTFIYISILPALSRLYLESKEKLKEVSESILKYIFVLFLPISFGLYITADKTIHLLYSETFHASGIVLKILGWIIIAGFAQALFSAILTAIDRQKEKVYVIGLNFALSVPLNILLIYYFNYAGAAVAKLVTTVLGLIFFIYLVYKYLSSFPLFKALFKPLLACLIMTLFAHFFIYLNLVYLILASTVLYVVSLLLLGTFTTHEITFIKGLLPGRIFGRSEIPK